MEKIHKTEISITLNIGKSEVFINMEYVRRGESLEYKLHDSYCTYPKIDQDILKGLDKMFKTLPIDIIHKHAEVEVWDDEI